jgi:ABC-2 type transport system permease protein
MTLAALIETEGDSVGKSGSDQAAEKKPEADKDAKKATNEEAKKDGSGKKSDAVEAAKPDPAKAAPARIRAIYVADIDLMIPAFLRIRARPDEQDDIRWEFENVTFLLNTIDVLANETDYVEIRKRKPRYTTLKVVEEQVEQARDNEFAKRVEFRDKFDKALKEAEAKNEETMATFRTIVTDLQKQQSEGKEINQAELREKVQLLEEQKRVLDRRLGITKQRLQRERERDIQRIQRDVDLQIQRMQFRYKAWAVAIPWIPPFLVGIVVFVLRRLREREGIEKSRLR